MASNKHALIRYKALDKCFRNHTVKYTFSDLINEVTKALETYDSATNGISRATLYADIQFMESADGWSIELTRTKNGRDVYISYTDPEFSINNMPLNEVEVNHLKEAMGLLSQFKGMPQFEWVEEVIPKLQQGIKPDKQKAIMSFDANQYLKGIEWLGPLHNAILYRRALSITYKDFKAPESYDLEIHPYYLKQYNNRWFLFGYHPGHERPIWNLALDRIVNVKDCKSKYKPNKDIDWEDYFEDILGVTKPENGKAEKIELLFAPQSAKYVLTKPIHGSQKIIRENENGLLISLEVMVNTELLGVILSFGERVKVVKPASLRNKITQSLSEALQQYAPPPTSAQWHL